MAKKRKSKGKRKQKGTQSQGIKAVLLMLSLSLNFMNYRARLVSELSKLPVFQRIVWGLSVDGVKYRISKWWRG